MQTIFSRCFLSCNVSNVGSLLLNLLGFRKGRLLFLSGFFLCINVSLGFVGLAFTFAFLFVGVVAGLLAAVGCFGAEVFVDPLFRFGVGFLFVAGVGVSWGSKGLHAAVGVCTCVFGAVSVASLVGSFSPLLVAALLDVSSPLGTVAFSLPSIVSSPLGTAAFLLPSTVTFLAVSTSKVTVACPAVFSSLITACLLVVSLP